MSQMGPVSLPATPGEIRCVLRARFGWVTIEGIMINGKNIIVISSVDWEFNWQGPQEIASRLAKNGNRVLFVENTGVRTPRINDFWRVVSRLKHWLTRSTENGALEVLPNLFVCSPLVAPPFGSRFRRYLNKKILLPSVKRIARKLGMEEAVVWTFLPTDTAADLVKMLWDKQSPIIYYVAGDFDGLIADTEKLEASENEIVSMSSTILTICPGLSNKYEDSHEKVHTFPYGVDLFAFESQTTDEIVDVTAQIVDAGLNKESGPVIGYVGGISRHLDLEMIEESVRLRSDWQWVFVGPVEADVSRLRKLPNVTFFGMQPHKSLVHYINRFDVCTIPYERSAYTDTVFPVKLNEYLAVGKPVVATSIPMVRKFYEENGTIKICGHECGDFIEKIESCLEDRVDGDAVFERRQVASKSDWAHRFEQICEVVGSDA
jgi:glycosyltransferase involved in cell wall biosynthesis